jgi:hypothetical protein
VEVLFKEDLSILAEEQIRCLKYVATRAPIAVSDVEDNFARETTNSLIHAHFLIRSGMNYVIYWDIFRDYLVEGRVPHIPWARTFQRGPVLAVRTLQELTKLGPAGTPAIAVAIGLKERPCMNLLGDLVALQLVDRDQDNLYKPAAHLEGLAPAVIALHAQNQLKRHVVVRELGSRMEKGKDFDAETWDHFFASAQPGMTNVAQSTLRTYATTLRSWLAFAWLLEAKGQRFIRPVGSAAPVGFLQTRITDRGQFLGTGSPNAFRRLLQTLKATPSGVGRKELLAAGLRNALRDAMALGLITIVPNGGMQLCKSAQDDSIVEAMAKAAILKQETVQFIKGEIESGNQDWNVIGENLRKELAAPWVAASTKRYINGLRRYYAWATGMDA